MLSGRLRGLVALLVLSGIISAAGCASDGAVVPAGVVALPVPLRPVLPVIEPEALGCLSAAAYEALVTRDAMLQAHIRRLEVVMRSTDEHDE